MKCNISARHRSLHHFEHTFISSTLRISFICDSFIVQDRSSTMARTRLSNASSRTRAASLTSRTTSVIMPGVYIPANRDRHTHMHGRDREKESERCLDNWTFQRTVRDW